MKASAPSPGSSPAASVVVPTHGRPGRLARLLASLAAQSVPAGQVEILVVDDGSPAGRSPSEASLPPNARLFRQSRQGPAAARNAGAARARGALLAFVDDDCVAEPGWLAALLDAHAAHPLALLGGATRNGLPDNLVADVAESLLGFLEEDERRRGAALSFVASNNIACDRAAFVRLGGFDTGYPLAAGEDRAFCRSWRALVGEIVRVPAAKVLHCHDHDLASFWRQQHNYGRGAARFHATAPSAAPAPGGDGGGIGRATDDEPGAARSRPGVLPREPAFYARLLTHYLRRDDRPLARRLAAFPIVALSQLGVASGLLRERRASGRPVGRP